MTNPITPAMTPTNTTSLRINLLQLYKADFNHLPESVLRNLEMTEEIQQLKKTTQEVIPGSNWSILRTEILAETQHLLEVDLYPILIESWKTHQDVIREINAQKIQMETSSDEKTTIAAELANKISIVKLDEHEIKSTHSPSLSINIGDKTHLLRSFIGITLHLEDVMLKIQHGEITGILDGNLSGNGFMQYQNVILIEKDFLKFNISGLTASIPTLQKSAIINIPHNDASLHKRTNTTQQVTPSTQHQSYTTRQAPKKASTSTNMFQFIIGISLALLAVFLFWQLK